MSSITPPTSPRPVEAVPIEFVRKLKQLEMILHSLGQSDEDRRRRREINANIASIYRKINSIQHPPDDNARRNLRFE